MDLLRNPKFYMWLLIALIFVQAAVCWYIRLRYGVAAFYG